MFPPMSNAASSPNEEAASRTQREDELAARLTLGHVAEHPNQFAYALALAIQDFRALGVAPTLQPGGRYRDVARQMIAMLSRRPPRATFGEVAEFLRVFLREAIPHELPRARHADAVTEDERAAADRQFERDLFETQWADGNGDDGDSPRYLRVGLWRELAALVGRVPFNGRFVLPAERRDPIDDLRSLQRELRRLRDEKMQDGFAVLSLEGLRAISVGAPDPVPEPLRKLYNDSGSATVGAVDEALRWTHDRIRGTAEAGGVTWTDADAQKRVLRDRAAESASPSESTARDNVMRHDGATWTVTFDGSSRSVPNGKGMAYIAILVGRPHREMAAFALQRALASREPNRYEPEGASDTHSMIGSTAGLDEDDLRAYRGQWHELRTQLERALGGNDEAEAERLRRDIAAVEGLLRNETALDGDPRRSDSAVEKSRKAVSRAIDRAKEQIRSRFPLLAEHLDRHLSTGTSCVYAGDATWEVTSLPVA